MPQRDSTSHPQGRLGQERQAVADADEWINNVLGPHGGTLLSNKKERSTDVDTMRTELENMPCAQNQSQNHHIVHGFLCMKCLEKANLWRKEVGE